MPRSPWNASPGCRKKLGVPVLASVAAILRPTRPDLPIPVIISLPRHSSMRSTADTNFSSTESAMRSSAADSIRSVLRARSMISFEDSEFIAV